MLVMFASKETQTGKATVKFMLWHSVNIASTPVFGLGVLALKTRAKELGFTNERTFMQGWLSSTEQGLNLRITLFD